MAGFFGLFDYNKPGPGVPRDAPPKSPFIVFFEILQRKFWNFVKVNLMFLIFNIPAIIFGMFVLTFFFPNILPDALKDSETLLSDVMLKFIFLTLMMCIPMVTTGPAQAGFTYIMRNYAREEHAFIWSDFKETAIKNMKQSLIISTINSLLTFIMLFSIRAYMVLGSGNFIMTAGSALMVVLFIIFAVMNMYIYPIMITFDLKIKQIYKNALIFAVVKFLPNVGILLLSVFLIILSFYFNPIIGIIIYLFFTVSLIGFLTNFYVYPKLKKYMISRIEEEEDEDDEEEEEDEISEEAGEASEGGSMPIGPDNDDEQDDSGRPSGSGEEEAGENGDASKTDGDDGIKRYF